VERTAHPVQNALQDAGIRASDLNMVLLVGGSTRIPAVQAKVRQLTGREPSKNLNPDECVALGACIQGGTLGGEIATGSNAADGGILLLDVTPLSLSVETVGGIATRLIERNTTLPTHYSKIFTTASNFQTGVEINVLQGERHFARDNKSLGKFRLSGIKRAMRGVPQIEVTFDIDANGIVNVSARDLATGRQQSITISGSTNMSDNEIQQAIRNAAQYEQEDNARKANVEALNDGSTLVARTEEALAAVGKQLPKEQQKQIRTDLAQLYRLVHHAKPGKITDQEGSSIRAATQRLNETAQPLLDLYEASKTAGGNAKG
jgi:molecular chaperone DnaK